MPKAKQQQKNHNLNRQKAAEPDMTGMVELLDWEFKTAVIHMLRSLMDKVDSMQEQMGVIERRKS